MIHTLETEATVALENIIQLLDEQKSRLEKELNAVVKMIRAAGKGVQAGIEEFDRSRKRGRIGKAVAKIRRKRSASVRKRMAAAQKARWARVKAAETKGKATKSQLKTATKAS
jgi:hypothetical protein